MKDDDGISGADTPNTFTSVYTAALKNDLYGMNDGVNISKDLWSEVNSGYRVLMKERFGIDMPAVIPINHLAFYYRRDGPEDGEAIFVVNIGEPEGMRANRDFAHGFFESSLQEKVRIVQYPDGNTNAVSRHSRYEHQEVPLKRVHHSRSVEPKQDDHQLLTILGLI